MSSNDLAVIKVDPGIRKKINQYKYDNEFKNVSEALDDIFSKINGPKNEKKKMWPNL